jgi:geranylgeranyl diphosphate synthase type II
MDLQQALQKSLEDSFALKQATLGALRLHEAMAYSLLGEGKRLRPLLVLEAARACSSRLSGEQADELALPAALAVEYVHTYSLIHDDLPAMDNDDLRRGKPTSHKKFDEATAILSGDALLSDAFGLLARARVKAAKQCLELSLAIGSLGMVGGQMDDILSSTEEWSEHDLLGIHRQKTGRLFECAAVLGAVSVDASGEIIGALRAYGAAFGLAFQLVDDCLDESMLVRRIGVAKVKALAQKYTDEALLSLDVLGERSEGLRQFARVALARTH